MILRGLMQWPGSGVLCSHMAVGDLVWWLVSVPLAGKGWKHWRGSKAGAGGKSNLLAVMIPLASTQNVLMGSARAVSSPPQLGTWLLCPALREGKSKERKIRMSQRIIGPELVLM